MFNETVLKNSANKLAVQCKQGNCSLGQALLTLQGQIEIVAKSTVYQQRGCLPPGSWIDTYVSIRASTNKEFWAMYRAQG